MSAMALLAELAEIEVIATGAGDHVDGSVPQWCELVLDLTDDSATKRIHLRRHDAELIIEALHEVLHPNTHRTSPVARLWEELDDTMDFLRADDEPEEEDRIRARTLAFAIALLTQPYSEEPDISAVRTEAASRWESRQ
jgi:hypothetical protein